MWGRIAGLMLAFGWAWTGIAAAQAPSIPERPRFEFPTTPEVVVKLKNPVNQKFVRGKLLSLTAQEVVIDTGKMRDPGEVGHRIAVDRIESVRSADGRFQYTPDEDFKVVSERIVASYASATVEEDKAPSSPSQVGANPVPAAVTPPSPQTTTAPKKPVVNGLGQGGFGGIKNLTKPKKPDATPADMPAETPGAEGTTEPVPPATEDATSGATEYLLCSNCTKEIPASAIKTGVCPHCKIAFSNITPPPSKPGSNPFQKPTSPGNPGSGAFAPTGPAPSVPPSVPPANAGSTVIENRGFSIDSVPNWAKGGLFVLLVLVGWHLVFNR